ncbi:MAG: hypothetical protein RLN75_05005, partial [Longimicrobiales bacterium]
MRRMTAAALLAAVLVSSLPWEVAGLSLAPETSVALKLKAELPTTPDAPESAPAPDDCPCLCVVGPVAAVEGVSAYPGVSVVLHSVRTHAVG